MEGGVRGKKREERECVRERETIFVQLWLSSRVKTMGQVTIQ